MRLDELVKKDDEFVVNHKASFGVIEKALEEITGPSRVTLCSRVSPCVAVCHLV